MELVETGYVEPADATALAALTAAERDQFKSDKKKDAKALFFLFRSVHESVFPRIAAAKKSKEAWDILKIAYQGMEKVKTAKLQMLRRDIETLSMKESDTIDSFFTQIPLLSKHSRLRCLSAKEKVEVEKITEVVEEAKTKADIIVQAQAEGDAIKTKMKENKNDMNSRHNVNFAKEENKNPKNVLLTCNIAQDKQEDVGFLDSGCSNHMTGNIAMFSNLDEDVKSEVTTGTDTKIVVKGKGSVSIRARNGEQMIVPDVYYVPGLKCNLLSIGQLIDKGYNVFFKDDMCTITDIPPSKNIVAQVQMTNNRMFPLKLKADLKEGRTIVAVTQEVFQEQVKDENWLWHLRFGHLNFGGLNLLHRKGMVRGLPLIEKPDSLCEGCVLGKQHKESFPAGKSIRGKAPLEIVHSDVCGPMQVPSLGRNRYVLTFIDDYTRKTWVYMLKQKSEVFEKFRHFKTLVEK
eukprot:PITA_23366